MNIGLHDADETDFPNLALMKISAWHKAKGHTVEWFNCMMDIYDKIYSSKVFTWTENDPYLPEKALCGGTGYFTDETLPEDIEHTCPDYDLYNLDYSMGFLTRGCIRKCPHCFVPDKEGDIKAHADIDEFLRHNSAVLLDNNVLASEHGIKQIEKIIKLKIKVDFNQGLDARLIDDTMAKLLSKVKWLKPLRLACDSDNMIEPVRKAIELLRWYNCTPRRYFVYLLVKDIPSAIKRVKFLKGMAVDPFAQPFRDKDGTEPTDEQSHFARWVNMKAEFKSQTWEEYRERKMAGVE